MEIRSRNKNLIIICFFSALRAKKVLRVNNNILRNDKFQYGYLVTLPVYEMFYYKYSIISIECYFVIRK